MRRLSWRCHVQRRHHRARLCIGGPSCTPRTCTAGTARYCDKIGDGCGRELDCGTCAAGQTCNGGLCVPANCTPLTCNIAGGDKYCGTIGDGCGGTLDCAGAAARPSPAAAPACPGVCGTPPAAARTGVSCNADGRPVLRRHRRQLRQHASTAAPATTAWRAARTDHVCPSSGPGPCTNLQCQLDKPGECTGNGTTISGAGLRPGRQDPALQRARLRAQHGRSGPIPTGASCDRCDSPISGTPVAAALTDADGNFTITERAVRRRTSRWSSRSASGGARSSCHGHQVPDNAFNDRT